MRSQSAANSSPTSTVNGSRGPLIIIRSSSSACSIVRAAGRSPISRFRSPISKRRSRGQFGATAVGSGHLGEDLFEFGQTALDVAERHPGAGGAGAAFQGRAAEPALGTLVCLGEQVEFAAGAAVFTGQCPGGGHIFAEGQRGHSPCPMPPRHCRSQPSTHLRLGCSVQLGPAARIGPRRR